MARFNRFTRGGGGGSGGSTGPDPDGGSNGSSDRGDDRDKDQDQNDSGGFFDQTRSTVGAVGGAAKDAAESGVDRASDYGRSKVDQASETVDDAADTATDKASDYASGVRRGYERGGVTGAADEAAGGVDEAVGRGVDRGVDRARDTAQGVGQGARNYVGGVRRGYERGGVSGAADAAAGGADEAVGRGVDRTTDTAKDVAGGVREGVESGADRASDYADDVREGYERGGVSGAADEAAGGVDEAVGRGVDRGVDKARDTAQDVEQGARGVGEGLENYGENVAQAAKDGDARDVADELAGGTDEWVGRQGEKYGEALDVLAGSTDEAVGRAVESAKEGDISGVGDHLAGSADEAVGGYVSGVRRGYGRGGVAGAADAAAGGADEAVGRGVGAATDYGENVAQGYDRGGVAGGADEAAGGADEAVGRAVDAAGAAYTGYMAGIEQGAREGGLTGAGDAAAGNLDEAADQLARDIQAGDWRGVGDTLAGSADEYVANAEFDPDVAGALTGSGGFLTEEQEQTLSEAGEHLDEDLTGIFDTTIRNNPVTLYERGVFKGAEAVGVNLDRETTIAGVTLDPYKDGLGPTGQLQMGTSKTVKEVANPFNLAGAAESGAELVENRDEVSAGEFGESATALGREAGKAGVTAFKTDPIGSTGRLAGEIALGYAAGAGAVAAGSRVAKGAGTAGRVARGASKLDEAPVSPNIRRYYGEKGGGGEQFPGFRGKPGEDPTETFRRQADEMTPDEVKERLPEPDEGQTYATHTSDFDFDSDFEAGVPKSRPSDPDNTMFFGPETSPNFAGLTAAGSSTGSYMPRLPRLSDVMPTQRNEIRTVVDLDEAPGRVRNEKATMADPEDPIISGTRETDPTDTQLEQARASSEYTVDEQRGDIYQTTRGEESEFFAQDAEQGTAYVRSPANRNPGEAEAVVPGGTRFREIEGSGDLFYQMQGENIDVRLFEPVDADAADMAGVADDAAKAIDDVDAGGVYTAGELEDMYGSVRYETPDRQPYTPAGSPSGAPSGAASSSGGVPGASGYTLPFDEPGYYSGPGYDSGYGYGSGAPSGGYGSGGPSSGGPSGGPSRGGGSGGSGGPSGGSGGSGGSPSGGGGGSYSWWYDDPDGAGRPTRPRFGDDDTPLPEETGDGGLFDQGWTNPVLDAREAMDRLIGGGR